MTGASSKLSVPAIFLDRDGTIMRDVDYCSDPKEVEILPGVVEALRRVRQAGFRIFVISNQSGIGRGYFSDSDYQAVAAEVERRVGDNVIDATYYCPHAPDDGCECRKPLPKMVFDAARDHDVVLASSFFIGDKVSDLECGRSAGMRTILVRTGYGETADARSADFVAQDLSEAVSIILRARP